MASILRFGEGIPKDVGNRIAGQCLTSTTLSFADETTDMKTGGQEIVYCVKETRKGVLLVLWYLLVYWFHCD